MFGRKAITKEEEPPAQWQDRRREVTAEIEELRLLIVASEKRIARFQRENLCLVNGKLRVVASELNARARIENEWQQLLREVGDLRARWNDTLAEYAVLDFAGPEVRMRRRQLTPADEEKIRELRRKYALSFTVLAARFTTTYDVVRKIVRAERKHI